MTVHSDTDRHLPAKLSLIDAAKRAVAKARSVDEVMKIKRTADQQRAYARIAKDKRMLIDAEIIRANATRRLGQLMRAQAETVGLAKGTRGSKVKGARVDDKPTLTEAGIDKNLADRARKLAKLDDDAFEDKVEQWRDDAEADSALIVPDMLKPHMHRARGTGKIEWYTPSKYLDAVRDVLGEIDLDPASSEIAQRTVNAARYYTITDDGLTKAWRGKVWLNPPSTQIEHFVAKLIAEYQAGHVTEAILLTHNYSETAWFQSVGAVADAICFLSVRVRFIDNDGEIAKPTQGQAFFYFGPDVKRFADVFGEIGVVVFPKGGPTSAAEAERLKAAYLKTILRNVTRQLQPIYKALKEQNTRHTARFDKIAVTVALTKLERLIDRWSGRAADDHDLDESIEDATEDAAQPSAPADDDAGIPEFLQRTEGATT
jgi:ParB family chromosome partitioning protein